MRSAAFFVLALLPFYACSVKDSHKTGYDFYFDESDAAWPSAGTGSAGFAGGGGSQPVIVTQPCWAVGCDPDRFCDGVSCVERPTRCPLGGEPACGLDGQTYESACQANLSGVGVTPIQSQCPAPPGYFFCGGRFCNAASSFCNDPLDREERLSTPAENLGCLPLPAACLEDHSCRCMYTNAPFPLDTCCTASDLGVYFGCVGEVP